MAPQRTPLSPLPANSVRGRPRKRSRKRSRSPNDREARNVSRYRNWSTNNNRGDMPTSGVAKAKKSKATSRSANSFEILADQDRDKENDPSRSGTV